MSERNKVLLETIRISRCRDCGGIQIVVLDHMRATKRVNPCSCTPRGDWDQALIDEGLTGGHH